MIRRALASGALVALLASCADEAPRPSSMEPAPASMDASPSSAHASEAPTAIRLPEPGQPFDAAALLAAMRDSRRPGGVPDELETGAIAATLADAVWTIDGEPWSTISAGGSCGPQSCTLEIAGAAADAPGDDLWVFEVTPGPDSVEVASAELRSMPPDLMDRLDELTRSLHTPVLEPLELTSARWLPPPNDTQFVLSYRSGEEERSSCGLDVTVDVALPGTVSDRNIEC